MLSPRSRSALLGGFFLALMNLGAVHAAGVHQFSPQGEVDRPIRATAVLSANMVPLGRSDAAAPFVVDCGEVKGRARWGDARSWSYTLERPLQAGERCDFRLKPGLTASNGEAVSGESSYAFFAPGPTARSAMKESSVSPERCDEITP